MNPKSKKPNKQRKYQANLALHQKQKRLSVHLSKELRKEYKTRAVPLKKGDLVKVVSGNQFGKTGKVTEVNYDSQRVAIEKIMRKKSDGKEIPILIHASNLMIMELETKDDRRFKNAPAKKKKTHEEAPEKTAAPKKTVAKAKGTAI